METPMYWPKSKPWYKKGEEPKIPLKIFDTIERLSMDKYYCKVGNKICGLLMNSISGEDVQCFTEREFHKSTSVNVMGFQKCPWPYRQKEVPEPKSQADKYIDWFKKRIVDDSGILNFKAQKEKLIEIYGE